MCSLGSTNGTMSGAPAAAVSSATGSTTARPTLLVPKLGYSENSSRTPSTAGTWNEKTCVPSGRGSDTLHGADVVSGFGVMTSLRNGDACRYWSRDWIPDKRGCKRIAPSSPAECDREPSIT
jgi:hypothetical protein